jgi:hypothetical protein
MADTEGQVWIEFTQFGAGVTFTAENAMNNMSMLLWKVVG